MSPKVINREDFEILFFSHFKDNLNKIFIVYYVTTNDLKFYRMNYPLDSIQKEDLDSGKLDTSEFITGAIERRHHLHKEVSFGQMNVKLETWGSRSYKIVHDYYKRQKRDNKINQIIK